MRPNCELDPIQQNQYLFVSKCISIARVVVNFLSPSKLIDATRTQVSRILFPFLSFCRWMVRGISWSHGARLLAREPRKDFNVAIITPCSSHAGRDAAERFTVKAEIPVDANWRNSAESQLFREAIEIFTFVFKVNCSKFRELLTGNLPQPSSEHQLVWELWPVGVLPQVNRPPTWGALLGGFDNSWVYSSEFRSAMRELDTLGKCEIGDFRGSELQWTCAFPASRIQGRQMIDESEDSRSFKLSSLLDLGVPPIVEQFVKQGEAAMAHISNRSRVEYNESPGGDMTSSASALCQYVAAK